MTPIHIDTYGFPGAISELVARSTSTLPEFNTNRDGDFIRGMAEIVLTVFWAKYMEFLPSGQHAEMMELMQKNDEKKLKMWMEEHCNILEDPQAKKRAELALADLQTSLPAIVKKEYNNWIAQTKTE